MPTLLISRFLVATIFAPPVTSITIGPANITLGESTFASVAQQLGNAALSRRGDAGESRVQACYVTMGSAPVTYYLESGELGGGDHILQVDVVDAHQTTAAILPVIATQCTKITAAIPATKTNLGLTLGLSRSEVEQILHETGREVAGVTLYEKAEKRGDGARVLDVFVSVRVRYVDGRVASFSVSEVSTT